MCGGGEKGWKRGLNTSCEGSRAPSPPWVTPSPPGHCKGGHRSRVHEALAIPSDEENQTGFPGEQRTLLSQLCSRMAVGAGFVPYRSSQLSRGSSSQPDAGLPFPVASLLCGPYCFPLPIGRGWGPACGRNTSCKGGLALTQGLLTMAFHLPRQGL